MISLRRTKPWSQIAVYRRFATIVKPERKGTDYFARFTFEPLHPANYAGATSGTDAPCFAVMVSGRGFQSDVGWPVKVPSKAVGHLMLAEMQGHLGLPKEKPLPLTSLLYRAAEFENNPTARSEFTKAMLRYLDTDTLCFWTEHPKELYKLQEQRWRPIIELISQRLGEKIAFTSSIAVVEQEPHMKAIFGRWLGELSSFHASAFEVAAINMRSVLLAYALVEKIVSADEASRASLLEMEFQTDKWGAANEAHNLNRLAILRSCLMVSLHWVLFGGLQGKQLISDDLHGAMDNSPPRATRRFPRPNPVAFGSTGVLPKKQRPTVERLSLPLAAMQTPQTPSKKTKSKFVVPVALTPFPLSPFANNLVATPTPTPTPTTPSSSLKKPIYLLNSAATHQTLPPRSPSRFSSADRSSSPLPARIDDCIFSDVFMTESMVVEDVDVETEMDLDSEYASVEVTPAMIRPTLWRALHPNFLDADYFVRNLDSQEHKLSSDEFPLEESVQMADFFTHNFEIIESLGFGSFADVFKVRARHDGLIYAVKKTREPFMGMTDRNRRLKEVKNLWRVRGAPNCVQIYSAWEQRGHLYVQTEICENGSLKDVIEYMAESQSRFTELQIWQMLHQISNGLMHIHRSGIIHLDIKPANIMIHQDGNLRIADFGLSTEIGDPHDPDSEGDKYYMAPEVLEGVYDRPADVFSLGLLALELATDVELPSQGDSWQNLRHGDYSELSFDDVSDALNTIIKEMTEPDPTRRPSIESVFRRVGLFIERSYPSALQ